MAKKPENDALKSACDGRKLREEEKGNGKKMSQKSLASFDGGLRFENIGFYHLLVNRRSDDHFLRSDGHLRSDHHF